MFCFHSKQLNILQKTLRLVSVCVCRIRLSTDMQARNKLNSQKWIKCKCAFEKKTDTQRIFISWNVLFSLIFNWRSPEMVLGQIIF